MGKRKKFSDGGRKWNFGQGRRPIVAPVAITFAGIVAYANSFNGPFLFDDKEAIVENRTIRRLWPPSNVLEPPRNTTVAGRPVANVTLAINYAFGGLSTRGYHVVNLGIHLCAGLVLFGIVRRTLLHVQAGDSHRLRAGATKSEAAGLATAVALLWVVHPLQTESVTYIVQRVESLVGLFYLLTVYAAIRYAERPAARWLIVALVACVLGMGTKEVMATAPVVVLLYDRAFLAGTFREALRRRWGMYTGLAATWTILLWLAWDTPRSTTVGIGIKGISPLTYATTQLGVITHYLRLALWPHPLCLDYAWPPITPAREAIGPGLFIGALLVATVWAMVRRKAAGFLGASFFLILAPTSSFVTIKDPAFEHRMYLPLAAVITVVVVVVDSVLQSRSGPARRTVGAVLLLIVAAGLGGTTIARNRVYQSEIGMWEDVLQKRPNNPRGHFALGVAKASLGRRDEAIGHYLDALALEPNDAYAHNNLAIVYAQQGRSAEAIAEYERALELRPNHAESYNNLGVLLSEQGRLDEAISRFQAAIGCKSDWAGAHSNLGNALSKVGRLEEAEDAYRMAIRLEPDSANAHNNLAGLLVQLGRAVEAPAEYETALRLAPTSPVIRTNYADCLMRLGRTAEAAEQYRRVLAANPNDAQVRAKLEAAERARSK